MVAILVIGISGCGGNDRRQSVNPATTTAARFLELRSDASAGTIHFPRGLYALDTEDRNGYYYRAPGKVYQHSFPDTIPTMEASSFPNAIKGSCAVTLSCPAASLMSVTCRARTTSFAIDEDHVAPAGCRRNRWWRRGFAPSWNQSRPA